MNIDTLKELKLNDSVIWRETYDGGCFETQIGDTVLGKVCTIYDTGFAISWDDGEFSSFSFNDTNDYRLKYIRKI